MGGSGGELVNQPPYVGVEHRIILAANAQCHIRIPFILFSLLSSLILWLAATFHTQFTRYISRILPNRISILAARYQRERPLLLSA